VKPGVGPNARRQRARKRAADAEYRIAREQGFVQARGVCEVCHEKPATQTHHRQRRSQGVDHSVSNLVAVDLWCHDRIHTNVAWAKEEGWLA